jgi:hypothetical protein
LSAGVAAEGIAASDPLRPAVRGCRALLPLAEMPVIERKRSLSLLLNLADCSGLLASRQGAGYLSVCVDAALVETGRVAVLMMIPLGGTSS